MEKKNNLSCVILTRNEEKNIERAIRSVSFCDEVIVIDDNSEDLTQSKSKKLGAKVYERPLNNDFAGQRNFALEKTRGEWVLFLDADEEVSEVLSQEILTAINDSRSIYDGYYIKRRDIIWGKTLKYGENGNTKLLRLGKARSGEWVRKVHETWNIKGGGGVLNNFLLHHSHETVRKFVEHVNYMSRLHAEENLSEGKRSSLIKIILWPKFKFINNYFLKLGFLDGIHGLVASILMSFHSFLAWGAIWLLQQKLKKTT